MFKTIRTWIHRIKNYEVKMEEVRKLSKKHEKQQKYIKELRNELQRFVSLLSGGTWQEGDNRMEAIEAYQQTKYLKEHAEDFLMIMTQNAPEVAAQELFEYFELEVPDSTEIELQTAEKIYDIWCRAIHESMINMNAVVVGKKKLSFNELPQERKEFFIKEVYKLWKK